MTRKGAALCVEDGDLKEDLVMRKASFPVAKKSPSVAALRWGAIPSLLANREDEAEPRGLWGSEPSLESLGGIRYG